MGVAKVWASIGRAVDSGHLTVAAATAWLHHLRTEQLFAPVTLFVTLAERPGT